MPKSRDHADPADLRSARCSTLQPTRLAWPEVVVVVVVVVLAAVLTATGIAVRTVLTLLLGAGAIGVATVRGRPAALLKTALQAAASAEG